MDLALGLSFSLSLMVHLEIVLISAFILVMVSSRSLMIYLYVYLKIVCIAGKLISVVCQWRRYVFNVKANKKDPRMEPFGTTQVTGFQSEIVNFWLTLTNHCRLSLSETNPTMRVNPEETLNVLDEKTNKQNRMVYRTKSFRKVKQNQNFTVPTLYLNQICPLILSIIRNIAVSVQQYILWNEWNPYWKMWACCGSVKTHISDWMILSRRLDKTGECWRAYSLEVNWRWDLILKCRQ